MIDRYDAAIIAIAALELLLLTVAAVGGWR